jgi:adenosylcobinamide-phosphate synthase
MLISSSGLFIVIAALAFDALIGDPEWLWRRVGHPVTLIGALIDRLDRKFNREDQTPEQRRSEGINSTAILVVIAATVGVLIQVVVQSLPAGNIILALIASIFIAQRSLYQHVAGVRAAFAEGGLPAAREAVAMIVGRDPAQLDEAGVCRAAIESCAENFSDGVVAPVFWLALLGLVNLVPARLSALLLACAAPVAGGSIATSWRIVRRDASHHRSPNAGWPESAMAGALGLPLAGPRRYAQHTVDDPFLNAEATSEARPDDIGRALDLYVAACVIEAAIYAALALVV